MPPTLKHNHKLKLAIYMSDKQQYEIAAEAGLWPTELSTIKRGQRNPGPDIKRRIADALGMEVSDLFDDEQVSSIG